MPVGRKRRIARIGKRALAFEKDLARKRDFKEVVRDRKPVFVGTGLHKGLVAKEHRNHVGRVALNEKRLLAYLDSGGIVPENYELVKVGFDRKTGIQEYFQRPSVNSLIRFFKFREIVELYNL